MVGFYRPLLTVSQRMGVDPDAYLAARNLSIYLRGDAWSASTPSVWISSASAGNSGSGKRFRRDRYSTDTGYHASSADPSATTVGGKQWVLTHTNGSPMVLRNAANSAGYTWFDSEAYGPGDWTLTAAVRYDTLNRASGTSGGSISAPPNANGTIQPGVGGDGTVRMWQRSASSTDQLVVSASGLISASEVCIVQSQYDETNGVLRFRKNKGSWVTYSGTATDRSPTGDFMCIMNAWGSSDTFRGALGALVIEQSFVTTDIDAVADAVAAIAGVTL